jgi:V/A-type H+-transporting ATPase subunit I
MIVPMKKAVILVQAKDAQLCLKDLRKIGVVHVEHQRMPAGGDIRALEDDLGLVNELLIVLTRQDSNQQAELTPAQDLSDWKATARRILDLRNRLNQLKDYAITLDAKIAQWQAWGDFEPDRLRSLTEQGIYARLYQIPVKEINNLPSSIIVEEISRIHGIADCLVISREKINLRFNEVTLPAMGLAAMQKRLSEDKDTMIHIQNQLRQHVRLRKTFMRIKKMLRQDLRLQQALNGMGRERSLAYLTGYIPDDAVAKLAQEAAAKKWGLLISEPGSQDRVPTLIRNPRWLSIIKPVFKLIEVIPGYKELDISLWFLIFFSIFFGMLIGDAGIGLIFFTLTAWAQMKWGRRLKNKFLFILFYLLSSCSIIWGALSGTFFGQAWLEPHVQPLIPALRNDKSVQTLCFLLGALHLSIAHSWRALIKLPSLRALAEIGWIIILWGAFFLARMLVLGEALPVFGKWFFILGPALVILFTNPTRDLLRSLRAGLGNLLLNLVNSFTDVVSYVRLFAVGLATVAVADSFNKMAMGIGYSSITSGIITSFILILGHTLNVVLAPMSILVHGVRLNVLEFCNHLDVKWSGFSYQPLQEKGD